MTICMGLRDSMSLPQAEYVISKLAYSVEGIVDCRIDPIQRAVLVETARDAEEVRVSEALEALLSEAETVHPLPRHRLHAHEDPNFNQRVWEPHAFAQPLSAEVRECEAKLMAAIDHRVRQWAGQLGANFRQYPSIIPYQVLEQCHYLWEFPQDLFLVYECPHDAKILASAKSGRDFTGIARPTELVLAPAVCYQVYDELAGRRLFTSTVVTAAGSCYRHEAPWRIDYWRALEFHMREIVFLGSQSFVNETRHQLLEITWTWFRELGLSGAVETASDPFYFSKDYVKQHRQLRDGTKYELVVNIPHGPKVALASFNDVGQDLCRPFGIVDADGQAEFSGCVGFGLERWSRALIFAYGSNMQNWPLALRNLVNEGI